MKLWHMTFTVWKNKIFHRRSSDVWLRQQHMRRGEKTEEDTENRKETEGQKRQKHSTGSRVQ